MTAGSAAATAISVNNSTGPVADFTSIRAAINAAHPGDEIIVKPGTYEENITVNKNLTIVSESGNPSNTIIQAAKGSEDIFSVWTNGVSINGFSIKGAKYAGIHLFGVTDCNITNNKLSNNGCGIDLYMFSSGNLLDNNKISDSTTGISLGDSWYNSLNNNSVSNCSGGISLFDSQNNTLNNNLISKNSEGIALIGESNSNILTNNTINSNEKIGLHIYGTSNNLIYNNYFNNIINVEAEQDSGTNIWNTTKTKGINIVDGPYLGGNSWARPDGTVYPEGARDTNFDGIFDEQYNIEGSNFIDYLPLKESKRVTITVGNSTDQIADFTSVQAAIDNASPGDTILLHPGVYTENINVYVTNLTLTSESGSSEDTIIKAASGSNDVFYVIADGVTISGLNITGPISSPNAGIHLNGVKHCLIENNQLSGNYSGEILNTSSGNNSSTGNDSNPNSEFGILLDASSSNILNNNNVSDIATPILLRNSSENILVNNKASNSSYGIWMNSSSNNTLNGNNVSNNKIGIYLEISNGNTLSNSTVLNNTASGINILNSSENTLNNSTTSDNRISILLHNSSGNLLNNNMVSNSTYGVWLYSSSNNNELTDNRVSDNNVSIYLKNSGENLLTGNRVLNSNGLGICLWNSAGNTLNNNTASDNASIFLHNSSENTLVNNTVESNNYGFWMNSCDNNKLIDNWASNNKFGVYLKNSRDNKLSGNMVGLNTRYGIYLGSSISNVLSGNRIVSNSEYGLYLMDSGYSSIYNNYLNNTNNTYFEGTNSGMSLNTTKMRETNIVGGPYLGGNFWATPESDGFSQTELDTNGDGICDAAYTLSNESIDYLPLAGSNVTN